MHQFKFRRHLPVTINAKRIKTCRITNFSERKKEKYFVESEKRQGPILEPIFECKGFA